MTETKKEDVKAELQMPEHLADIKGEPLAVLKQKSALIKEFGFDEYEALVRRSSVKTIR